MTEITTENRTDTRPHPVGSGTQIRFKFPNGYGASVVRFSAGPFGGSYGAAAGWWEIAVLDSDGHLTYETPITDDVIGNLDEAEINEQLVLIAALPTAKDAA